MRQGVGRELETPAPGTQRGRGGGIGWDGEVSGPAVSSRHTRRFESGQREPSFILPLDSWDGGHRWARAMRASMPAGSQPAAVVRSVGGRCSSTRRRRCPPSSGRHCQLILDATRVRRTLPTFLAKSADTPSLWIITIEMGCAEVDRLSPGHVQPGEIQLDRSLHTRGPKFDSEWTRTRWFHRCITRTGNTRADPAPPHCTPATRLYERKKRVPSSRGVL